MFPNGITHYLIGGLILGTAMGLLYLLIGTRAGASGVLDGMLSYVSKASWFKKEDLVRFRSTRVLFIGGVAIGALIYAVATGAYFQTRIHPALLFIGGALVGYGTRLSRGCTSGHGLQGLANARPASLLAVPIFIIVAIITAHIAQYLGLIP